MRTIVRIGLTVLVPVSLAAGLRTHAACPSCTGRAGGCEPACRATWQEKKTKDVAYEIRCEPACARSCDPWHAPPPECRCRPPDGRAYVKKRLYKSDGTETVERVPTYEPGTAPVESCRCCEGRAGQRQPWNPLGILSFLHTHRGGP